MKNLVLKSQSTEENIQSYLSNKIRVYLVNVLDCISDGSDHLMANNNVVLRRLQFRCNVCCVTFAIFIIDINSFQ